MANGFDRLERFFASKRKATAVPSEPSTAPSSTPSSPTELSTELSFPSPSFIRPKASRMAAREECRLKQPATKSPTAPDVPCPVRNASTQSNSSRTTAASRRLKASRTRSASLGSEHQMEPVSRGFEFPKPPSRRCGDALPWSAYDSKPLPGIPRTQGSRPGSPRKLNTPVPRLDTPPSSDPEDSPLASRRPKARKLQIVPPHKAPPTPESSPEIGPVSDWQLHENKPVGSLDEDLCRDIQRQLEGTCGPPQLGACFVQPDFQAPVIPFMTNTAPSELSFTGTSLQEPDFDEFLSLSDDNVAESDLESVTGPLVQTPVNVEPSVSSLPLRDAPLLTLEPPSASQPAAAAAFKAARIAGRYNFDMLYVVNLWPGETDARPFDLGRASNPSKGMTGRLLAAYGLHNGPSPFQISSDVHMKILRSEGWLEYRDEQALRGDFSRAYACAFYPGQYEEKRSSRSATPIRAKETGTVDRGIVFAAYRKPQADGSIQYSSPEELAYLRRDVEAMVEALIDLHVANRMGQPPIFTRYPDETGPIPTQGTESSGCMKS